MISIRLFPILSWPFRALFKPVRRSARIRLQEPVGAAGKSAAGALAKTGAVEILADEYREEPPRGIESAMFRQLPRPRLTEKSASELSLEQAQDYAQQASRFYDFEFPLFTRGDFFYEEIEEEFLNKALGYDEDTIDRRFIDVTTVFRRTLNANSRGLLFVWAPMIGAITFLLAVLASESAVRFLPVAPEAHEWAVFGGAGLVSAFLVFLVYSWPYKVVQQRNLLNLDNYVTSKFARINNNFQVAKRRALNVERDKRMGDRDALQEEAGSWTLAYHWFAMRLFLCETMLRNKFYQVRRNTALYLAAGVVVNALVLAGVAVASAAVYPGHFPLGPFAAGAIGFIILSTFTTGQATGMMFAVLKANEWSRFAMINLDRTISDHVGEDKLQIVTFRDRNRFE